MYDGACGDDVLAQLTAAAEAVVTSKHFRGLEITLRRGDAPSGWDAAAFWEIMNASRDAAAVNERRPPLTA